MFAVEVVDLGMELAQFVPSFAHALVVCYLQDTDALAVEFLDIEEHHVVDSAYMAIEVADDFVLVEMLVDDDQGDRSREREHHGDLAVSEAGSLS